MGLESQVELTDIYLIHQPKNDQEGPRPCQVRQVRDLRRQNPQGQGHLQDGGPQHRRLDGLQGFERGLRLRFDGPELGRAQVVPQAVLLGLRRHPFEDRQEQVQGREEDQGVPQVQQEGSPEHWQARPEGSRRQVNLALLGLWWIAVFGSEVRARLVEFVFPENPFLVQSSSLFGKKNPPVAKKKKKKKKKKK